MKIITKFTPCFQLAYLAAVDQSNDKVDAVTKEEILSSLKAPKELSWPELMAGIARDHPRTEDSEHWSDSINQILRSTQYLSFFLPRTRFSTTSDVNMFSRYFKKEHAVFFASIANIYPGGISCELVRALFDAAGIDNSKDPLISISKCSTLFCTDLVPTTTGDELKDKNTLKSEIFSGFCRAVYDTDSSATMLLDMEHKTAVELLLREILEENVKSISLEYCKDWADAVSFGLAPNPIEIAAPMIAYVLESLEIRCVHFSCVTMDFNNLFKQLHICTPNFQHANFGEQ